MIPQHRTALEARHRALEQLKSLCAQIAAMSEGPVIFPPGRARLAATPVLSGSLMKAKTVRMTKRSTDRGCLVPGTRDAQSDLEEDHRHRMRELGCVESRTIETESSMPMAGPIDFPSSPPCLSPTR